MNTEELMLKIDRLESIEQIKQLKARYCDYCDDNYNPEGIASLFTEDGIWDAGEGFGCHKGKEEIKAFFKQVSADIVFASHNVMNPIIDVDGDFAKGQWNIFMPSTLQGEQAAWLLARYDETYQRVAGKWLIKSLKANIKFFSSYEKGWAKKPFLD